MKSRVLVTALAVVASCVAVAMPANAQVPSPAVPAAGLSAVVKTEVKGVLAIRARGFGVVMVAPDGRSIMQRSDRTTGRFRIVAPRAMTVGATLHLIATTGRYAGPVVLDVDRIKTASGANFFAHLRLTGADADLGVLDVPVGAKYAIASGLTAGAYQRDAVRATPGGAPFGVGRAGLVRRKSPVTAAELAKLTGTVTRAKRAEASNVDPGEDQDADGIPNFVDVDDNGNTSLDLSDPNSRATTGLSTWSDLRLSAGMGFNAHLGDVGAEDVATLVGTPNMFNVVFFIDQMSLTVDSQPDSIDFVYVDCGTLTYCGGSNPAAVTSDLMTDNRPNVPWADYRGGALAENGTPMPALHTLGVVPEGKGNALTASFRNEDRGQGAETWTNWVGFFNPNTVSNASGGADTFTHMRVGDVYTLTYKVHGEAGLRQRAMTLSPFAATVPGIVSVNGGAAPSGTDEVTLGGDGKLQLTFHRPQRLTVDGEEGAFKDLGGLYYGLILQQDGMNMEYGCNPDTYYSGLSGLRKKPGFDAGNASDSLWPLVDTTVADLPLSAAATLSFTVDVEACVRANNGGELPSGTYRANVTAAGQFMTGGANRATSTLSFRVE